MKPRALSVSDEAAGDYFVVFSRFVPYKRIDLAISACARLNKKLIVIGSGSQEKELKLLAASCKNEDIKFTGRISDSEVKAYLQKCRALIFCAEEDFGIIPVEAQACGRPIIAFGKGGALETVVNEKTGVFFEEQSVGSLVKAIEKFEKLDKENTFNPKKIREHAEKFSAENFRKNLSEQIRLTEDKVRNYI